MLGELVVPVLRREFAALRPANVPDGPPLHPAVIAARAAREVVEPAVKEAPVEAVAG